MKQFFLQILYKITNPLLVRINKELLDELHSLSEKYDILESDNSVLYNETLKAIYENKEIKDLVKSKNKEINRLKSLLKYYKTKDTTTKK